MQEDGELAGSLAARLQERGVRLEALLLDTPGGLGRQHAACHCSWGLGLRHSACPRPGWLPHTPAHLPGHAPPAPLPPAEDSAYEGDMMANRNVLSQICQEVRQAGGTVLQYSLD